ncbi:hypothetical protein BDZ97DRAFT_1765848 [Flammula alnicola]|nr:hypothetical protein BDZ97DRAFT_1765848 [Flammula alnicola]
MTMLTRRSKFQFNLFPHSHLPPPPFTLLRCIAANNSKKVVLSLLWYLILIKKLQARCSQGLARARPPRWPEEVEDAPNKPQPAPSPSMSISTCRALQQDPDVVCISQTGTSGMPSGQHYVMREWSGHFLHPRRVQLEQAAIVDMHRDQVGS